MFRNRQLYINGQEVYLDSDEIIPITKQVNNIAELKDRQADFTTDFKIPATRKNRLILESANLLSSNTFVPYVKNSCTYVEDGIELISDGYIVILSHEKGYFNAAAYSGNADFFKLIDKLKINNLDLSDLNHVWTLNPDLFIGNAYPDLKYLIFEPSSTGDLLSNTSIEFNYLRPFVSVKRLFKQIIEAQGWTLTGDCDVIDEWMLCPSLSPILSDYNSTAKLTNQAYTDSINLVKYENITEISDSKNLIQQGSIFLNGANNMMFKFARKGKYNITISSKLLFTNANFVGIVLKNSGGTIPIAINSNKNITQDFSVTYELEVDDTNLAYGVAFILGEQEANSRLDIYNCLFNIALTESSIQPNDTVQVSSIVPDMEQTKFLKTVANQYGLVFETDGQKREVNVWQFNRLLDNIPIANNWSKYVSEDSQVLSYRIGDYAQSNLMKYKETEGTPVGYGDGALIINNQTLETSKELFTLDFSASNDILKNGNICALIPLYERSDAGEYSSKDSKDARVVNYKFINSPLIVSRENINLNLPNYNLAYFINTVENKGLGFNYRLIEQNYVALSNMLTQSKKLEIKMKIPTIKIQGLKHYIPIYLEQFASYFYVNKINQWQKDKICTVELIKIA